MPKIDFCEYGITEIEQKQTDKSALYAITCTFDALKSSGLKYNLSDKKKNSYSIEGINPERSGVVLGTGIGGISGFIPAMAFQILNNNKTKLAEIIKEGNSREKELNSINEKMISPKRFNPFSVSMIMPNTSAANVGIKLGLKGINNTVSLACASGTSAIGNAYEQIKNGKMDFLISGGVEYMNDEYDGLFYSFDVIKTLCKPYPNIEESNQPFDIDRTGFLYSQGGCSILILEELNHALKRNSSIFAKIISFSEANDAHSVMVIENSVSSIEKMIINALKNADLKPQNIDYINSHGTGTILNDEVESAVIEKIFGTKVLINSTKSLIGHSLGASGAIEALVTVMSIKNKITHGCKNLEKPIRNLNFLKETTSHNIKTAISHSFGFGEHNSNLIFKEFE